MKVYNKIGFHLGPGGNSQGIGDYMRALDAAQIPFMIKSVDAYGPCHEAVGIAKQSGVPHTIVFRLSTIGQNRTYDYDVPPYKDPKYVNDPEGGAEKHWAETVAKLPPEFDKDVWIEPINEVDKELCDWLGRFAVHIANLAQRDGYKVSLFAWSSGEPEREGWEQPGMLDYLRLCGQRPNQAAVALHEYSYVVDDIKESFPYKIGRFQMLFDVCDAHSIPRPTLHITEWGWTLNNVPDPQNAIKDIQEIGELYAPHPQIKGAAIWYLGPSFGGIANKAQRLIKPVTEFTLSHTFDVELAQPAKPERQAASPTPRADPTAGSESTGATSDKQPLITTTTSTASDGKTAVRSNAQFIADVTIPDESQLPAGATFTKTWRVRNTGTKNWGGRYRLVHTEGLPMTATTSQLVPKLGPDQEGEVSVTLTAPTTPGIHSSSWRFQDGKGNLFGEMLSVVVVVVEAATPSPSTGTSGGAYVADVTIPDDTPIPAGDAFVKTWRVRNNGTRAWGAGFTLDFVNGLSMSDITSQPLPAAAPGAEVDISVPMRAPAQEGTYFCDWRMKDDQGTLFGDVVYARIVVTPKRQPPSQTVVTPLQVGMNINPDAPNSNPVAGDGLQGADWVRFVFKLAAREVAAERDNIDKAFAQFDPLIQQYNQKGIKSLIVLNQETVWGNAPWSGSNDWRTYANQLAQVAGQIAARYRPYGDQVGYEIWNEGDLPNNPASVFVEPEQFAIVLQQTAQAIRAASPQAPLVFGGLATGPDQSIAYLKRCLAALGGTWPVDAIGIHPYGRWATRPPFDWGQQFGTLGQAFDMYEAQIPGIPFWITEIGVAADNEIGPQYYAQIADYIKDVHAYIAAEYTYLVPVILWFAWSDWMRNAGVVRHDGSQKADVYAAYQAVLKGE